MRPTIHPGCTAVTHNALNCGHLPFEERCESCKVNEPELPGTAAVFAGDLVRGYEVRRGEGDPWSRIEEVHRHWSTVVVVADDGRLEIAYDEDELVQVHGRPSFSDRVAEVRSCLAEHRDLARWDDEGGRVVA